VSESGFTSWGILFFLAALVLVVFAALRMFATGVNLPALPLQDWLIYLILSLIMVAAAAIFWLSGGGYGVSYNGPGGSVGPSFGLFVALVAAVAAAVGAFLKKTDPQPATGPMNFGTPPSAAPPPPPPAPPAPPAPPTA
jgi:ABC-type multidrug transport system permease subunit